MEYNEIENSWKNMDSKISSKSVDELHHLLTKKSRKTMNKFFYFLGVDIVVCIGLLVFLLLTAYNRQDDKIYLVNNAILVIITIYALVVSLLSWQKLQNNRYNLSVKDWLEAQIKLLSKWLLGKYSQLYVIILIPVLLVMVNLSIHVYYEYKPFTEVMKNEDSIYGLVVAFVVGLSVSYYTVSKMRKYQLKNLEYLKELYAAL